MCQKILGRDYCFLLNSHKYNRNYGCKKHDNAYGINGGGGAKERKEADVRFYEYLKSNNDPMALLVFTAVRVFGWMFFNYQYGKPWKGQLTKKWQLNLRG